MAHEQQVRCKTSACFTTDFTDLCPVAFFRAAQTLPSPVPEPGEPQQTFANSKEVTLGWEEGGSKRQLLKKMQEEMHTCDATQAK